MAEEKAAAESPAAASGGQKPLLFIILAVVNMIVVAVVGALIYLGKKKEAAQPTIDNVIAGEKQTAEQEANAKKEFVGKVVPMETFIVNLAGSKGRRVAKVNMELELKEAEGEGKIAAEIEQRKAQIRDIIIIILSSKSYEEVSSREGKDNLRSEIKDTINSFLTTGKISNVFFTEFIYN
ncbi:MAG: flagellar basal body-associated protein FliL [Bdellovibrionales bacterium]